MLKLCDRCVQGVKNRGDEVVIKKIDDNGNSHDWCDWCETFNSTLFSVYFPKYNYGEK